MRVTRRVAIAGLMGAGLVGAGFAASRAFGSTGGRISVALQEGGTAAWEIAAMQAAGLDAAQGIAVDVRAVADSKGGQVALQAGAVDAMLSDFIWVSSQRRLGADFTFVPHALVVGGLMAPPTGPVQSVMDLAGQVLAVAGGPNDKSFIILQAYFNALTGKVLPDLITAKFGPPPLVNELLISGQAQAALNFWHFNVRAGLAGMRQVVAVKDMLAELGVSQTPPLLGWVFSENGRVGDIRRFLDASFATKALLLAEDAIWDRIRPVMKGAETDDALFVALRAAYRAGIVTSYGAADVQAARETYAVLARYGVGNAEGLAAGTFWSGYAR